MEIPLPPSSPKSREYSPSHITSPHSDDDEDSGSKPEKDKKVLSKKKASNILKSLRMSSFSMAKKSKFNQNLNENEESADLDEEALNLARAESRKLKEREKLNIEALIEEERNEKKIISRIDLMPNKAGSTFQRTREAVGPLDVDELHRQRAEEKAQNLAATMKTAIKGPVKFDNLGFVTAQVQPKILMPKEESPKRRKRSRSRSRERQKHRKRRDRSPPPKEKSIKDQLNIHEMPENWTNLKAKGLSIKSENFVKLKRAFDENVKVESKMTLVKIHDDHEDIEDPTVQESEAALLKCSLHSKLSKAKTNKEYTRLEFPKCSIKVTSAKPSIQWSCNKQTFLKDLYQTKRTPEDEEMVQSLKSITKHNNEDNVIKSQEWYSKLDAFMTAKPAAAILPPPEPPAQPKKSKSKSKKAAKVQDESEKQRQDLLRLLEEDLKNNESKPKKKKKKKDKKAKKKAKKAKKSKEDNDIPEFNPDVLESKLIHLAGYTPTTDEVFQESKKPKKRSEDPRSPSPPPLKKGKRPPRTPPPASVSPPTDPRLRRNGPRTPSPKGPRTPQYSRSRSRSPRSPRRSRSYRGSPSHRRGNSPHYGRSRYYVQQEFRLERSVADSTINDADLLEKNLSSNSPKRPSLDERLEKELGIKVDHLPDFSKPPPGYLEKNPGVVGPIRVGNMLQIVPDNAEKKVIQPAAAVAELEDAAECKAKELMRKLEEQKKRKEAERKLKREQRLADMQKKQLEEEPQPELQAAEATPQQTQQMMPPVQKQSSGRILESIEREEDKEARILAEAMTSVPEEEEEEEDIQGFSAAERRSKSRGGKKDDVRYISLKPFWKKGERKRQKEEESNGQDDLDDEEEENFQPASPVPLPDASTCKSILHQFGFDHKPKESKKKSLRYADGVLPGQGSPDHNAQDSPQSSLLASSKKRKKKILVRFIETRNPESSSDSDGDDLVPPPPAGSPKLYHSAEFVAKFACKDLLTVVS